VFSEQCFNTLLEKMATPPIKQFLPTLMKFINKNSEDRLYEERIMTIFRKTLQGEFI
jgi:Cys-tRNA synthase (O-phospho-L-seryl-tRNA:Cys-tRNA synthase)